MTQNAPTGRKMKGYSMPLFKLGKTHVPHRKNTADSMPVRMPPPAEVLIPMVMHIGAPAIPAVKVGDLVKIGTLVAEASNGLSSPIYASISGKVTKMSEGPSAGCKPALNTAGNITRPASSDTSRVSSATLQDVCTRLLSFLK